MKHKAIFASGLILLGLSIAGQTGLQLAKAEATFSWVDLSLSMSLQSEKRVDTKNRLAQTSRDVSGLKAYLTWMIPKSLENLIVDNHTKLVDLMKSNNEVLHAVSRFDELAQTNGARPDEAFQSSIVDYQLSTWNHFLEIFSPLGFSSWDKPLPNVFNQSSEDEITSIVILAETPLPVYGTNKKSLLVPCLFPSLRTDDSSVVVNHENRSRQIMAEQGLIQYADAETLKQMTEALGPRPYYIVAQSAFGMFPTDPVISQQEAKKLLGSKSARSILKKGLIVFLVDKNVLKSKQALSMLNE